MSVRKFTNKHWKAVAETARGYELVIEAIDAGCGVDEVRSTIKGFGAHNICGLCLSIGTGCTNSPYNCRKCIHGISARGSSGCYSGGGKKEGYMYIERFKKTLVKSTKALRRHVATRLVILNKLVDKAGYVLEDIGGD